MNVDRDEGSREDAKERKEQRVAIAVFREARVLESRHESRKDHFVRWR